MAYLQQRLAQTLLGHDLKIHLNTTEFEEGEMSWGELVDVGEDFLGVGIGGSYILVLIAHVLHIKHDTRDCRACP